MIKINHSPDYTFKVGDGIPFGEGMYYILTEIISVELNKGYNTTTARFEVRVDQVG